jgi:hypothetical protein
MYFPTSQVHNTKRVGDKRQLLKIRRTMFRIKACKEDIRKSICNFQLVICVFFFSGAGENYENTMIAFQRYVVSSALLLNDIQCRTVPKGV